MPTPAGDPLRKVTINLYDEDCDYLECHQGHGWSTWVRDIIHAEVRRAKATNTLRYPLIRRLGDLDV